MSFKCQLFAALDARGVEVIVGGFDLLFDHEDPQPGQPRDYALVNDEDFCVHDQEIEIGEDGLANVTESNGNVVACRFIKYRAMAESDLQ